MILIIFLFLATLRATIIPALAIPVSIIATFAILGALGYSINTFTLLGLILAIGIVVDDAIIVLENAYRHQEELHKDPETAAIDGTREITTAVIATTIALLAVFSPLLFLTGATGRLFNEFGVAVGGSVLISGIVALTLTPMLSAKILRVLGARIAFPHVVGVGAERHHARVTGALLDSALARPFLVIGGRRAADRRARCFSSGHSKREFVPPDDRGFFFTFVVAPEGATVAVHRRVSATARGDRPAHEGRAVDVRGHRIRRSAELGIPGRDSQRLGGARPLGAGHHRRECSRSSSACPGVFAFATNPPAFGGFRPPVQFVVQNRDFEALVRGMDTLVGARAHDSRVWSTSTRTFA